MSSESEWAALIYSRTSSVDFRFLAARKDFGSADLRWAELYILASARSPEKLGEGARWVMFRCDTHAVYGVACMGSELAGGDARFARDAQGRPVYLFAGLVAKLAHLRSPVPFPPYSRDVAPLRSLYRFVRDRWDEAPFEAALDTFHHSAYSPIAKRHEERAAGPSLELNFTTDRVVLWPDDETSRAALWQACAVADRPVSLCLGIATRRDASGGPFLNGTCGEAAKRTVIANEPVNEISGETGARASAREPAQGDRGGSGGARDGSAQVAKPSRGRGRATGERDDLPSPQEFISAAVSALFSVSEHLGNIAMSPMRILGKISGYARDGAHEQMEKARGRQERPASTESPSASFGISPKRETERSAAPEGDEKGDDWFP